MKFVLSWKYQLVDSWKAIVVYYIIIMALYGMMLGSAILSADMGGTSSMSGIEVATVIFLFVVGLNSFKDPFLFQIQNGVSRRTIWLGMGALALTLAVGMSAVDTLLYVIMKCLQPENMAIQTISDQLFMLVDRRVTFRSAGAQLLYESGMNLFAVCLGYMISMAYYRMNTTVKTLVSVGIPGMLLIGFPMIERFITKGALSRLVIWCANHTFGSPALFRWTICLLLCAGVLYGICYLLIRRAIVKS